MVLGTNSSCKNDEECRDSVADPDTNPCLPPRKADIERGCSDHPGIDVEGVSDPEADKVPVLPLSTFWLDRLEIVVGEEELLVGQAWLVIVDFDGPNNPTDCWMGHLDDAGVFEMLFLRSHSLMSRTKEW